MSDPIGFKLPLTETSQNSGVYQANITIMNRTSELKAWIQASKGETVKVTSIQDPNKSASILVWPSLKIYPEQDNKAALEDDQYSQQYSTTSPLPVAWTFRTNASWLVWDPVTHTMSGIPRNANVGHYYVNINLSYQDYIPDEHNFTLIVNNTPPMIATVDVKQVKENELLKVDYNSTDDGSGHVTWHLKTNVGSWLSINSTTGVLSGIPRDSDIGQHYINVSVDDGNGGRDSRNFTINVIDVNNPPKISGKDITEVYENTQYAANYSVMDPDKKDTVFTWTLKTNASWLIINSATGNITGTPHNSDVGWYWVNVTVKDPLEAEDYRNFNLTVINVNDPPVWTNVPKNATIKNTDTYTFDVNATDIDVENSLRYGIRSSPASTISIDPSTGVITWKPEAPGIYLVNVSVTDTYVTLYHEFVIRVNAPPTSSLVSPINGSQIGASNLTLQWTVSDKNGDKVTSNLYLSKDLNLVKTLSSSSRIAAKLTVLTFTPTIKLDREVTYYWTVIPYDGIMDGTCENGIWNFKITEAASNHPPVLEPINRKKVKVGETFRLTVKGNDPDPNDALKLVYGLNTPPEGMTIDPALGTINWKPTEKQTGTYTIVVTLSDGKKSVSTNFEIEVEKGTTGTGGWSASSLLLPIIVILIIVGALIGAAIMMLKRKGKGQIPQAAPVVEPGTAMDQRANVPQNEMSEPPSGSPLVQVPPQYPPQNPPQY
jgi:hypothetical protein